MSKRPDADSDRSSNKASGDSRRYYGTNHGGNDCAHQASSDYRANHGANGCADQAGGDYRANYGANNCADQAGGDYRADQPGGHHASCSYRECGRGAGGLHAELQRVPSERGPGCGALADRH